MKIGFIAKSVLSPVLLVITDQLSKYLIRSSNGFYICNKGVAWGVILPYKLIIIFAIIIIILLFIVITNYQFLISNKNPNAQFLKLKLDINDFVGNWKLGIRNYNAGLIAVLLIFAGAVSNIIDRTVYGCVIDFIDLRFWPVFNLADIFITSGAILLQYFLIKI